MVVALRLEENALEWVSARWIWSSGPGLSLGGELLVDLFVGRGLEVFVVVFG